MANTSATTATETKLQHFERLLSGLSFDGLKPILAALSSDRDALCDAVKLFVYAWNRRQRFRHTHPKYPTHVFQFVYPPS